MEVHVHKFTIPVEFEHYGTATLFNRSGISNNVLTKTRVTVLRCACGEELQREAAGIE